MRYVAAYLLAALGGNNSPSSDDIKKILGSVGIEAEDDKLNKVISELKGKNLEELIAEGLYIVYFAIKKIGHGFRFCPGIYSMTVERFPESQENSKT